MVVHVLNGDALSEQFPEELKGQRIVCRECLIEGPAQAESSLEFYHHRKTYLSKRFPESSIDYDLDIKAEFEKLVKLDNIREINLWFEDDLFCQVNLWYTISRLDDHIETINLVRPHTSLRHGFGSCDKDMLLECYGRRQELSADDLKLLNNLWKAYAARSSEELYKLKTKISKHLEFLETAIDAVINHQLAGESSLVIQTLKKIIKEKSSTELKEVYPELVNELPVYGFGDLQVLRLIEEVGEQSSK